MEHKNNTALIVAAGYWREFNAQLIIMVVMITLMLAFALLYFQWYLAIEPCAMCVTQRMAITAAGVILTVCLVHRSKSTLMAKSYIVLSLLFLLVGLGVAVRQIWLQTLPPEKVVGCGPSFDFILEVLPLNEVLKALFLGTGNCASVKWDYYGLTIPMLSFMGFLVLIFLSVLSFISLRRINKAYTHPSST